MDYDLTVVIRSIGWFIEMYLIIDLLMGFLRIEKYILGLLMDL